MKRKKMKINGFFIFSFIIGTFSLSLNKNSIKANLTEDATTLPSVDIAKSTTRVFMDLVSTIYGLQKTIQTPDDSEDQEEQNSSNSEEETTYSSFDEDNIEETYKPEDELTDFSAITTIKPQLHPSYFARFKARRNAEYNCEVVNENSETNNEELSDAYCTEKIKETTNDNENAKEYDSKSESSTESSLENNTTYDIPYYKTT